MNLGEALKEAREAGTFRREKLKKTIGVWVMIITVIVILALITRWATASIKEVRTTKPLDAPAPTSRLKPVKKGPVSAALVVTAPAKGTRSEPVVIDEVGPRSCWYSRGNVSVWYDNGTGIWQGPIPDGPGRNVNLGKFVGKGALAFESEDSRPVQIHFRDDCLS